MRLGAVWRMEAHRAGAQGERPGRRSQQQGAGIAWGSAGVLSAGCRFSSEVTGVGLPENCSIEDLFHEFTANFNLDKHLWEPLT